jgi:hypothetical protein
MKAGCNRHVWLDMSIARARQRKYVDKIAILSICEAGHVDRVDITLIMCTQNRFFVDICDLSWRLDRHDEPVMSANPVDIDMGGGC